MPPPWRVVSSNRLHWIMNDTVLINRSPPMWWLEPGMGTERLADEGDVLRFGPDGIPLEGIVSYRLEEVVERDFSAPLVAGALAFASGVVTLAGILGFGWLECLLAGFVILSGLVIAGLAELCGVTSRRRFRISIFSQDSRPVTYTSADNRDIARLIAFLDHAIGR
ncbi:hypothetical protein SAMN04488061_2550 [Filomicrobium insigne]|uniref:Uncharacterized protein n=2 Tax=Filomicrobium insigne TaxID=418854 RepID=A0A1H0QYL1_9HYPH|nr:hypothetical protein SAMN04488061_2550 [Filomicrobium insigne]